MTTQFIKEQQELEETIKKHLKDVEAEYNMGGLSDGLYADYATEVAKRTVTNTGEELLRLAEGEKTKNTEGKTYYDGHPDVIKDQAIDTLKKHIINVTGVE